MKLPCLPPVVQAPKYSYIKDLPILFSQIRFALLCFARHRPRSAPSFHRTDIAFASCFHRHQQRSFCFSSFAAAPSWSYAMMSATTPCMPPERPAAAATRHATPKAPRRRTNPPSAPRSLPSSSTSWIRSTARTWRNGMRRSAPVR